MEREIKCRRCREALAYAGPDSWWMWMAFTTAAVLAVTTPWVMPHYGLFAFWLTCLVFFGNRLWRHNVCGLTLHAYVAKDGCHIHGGSLPPDKELPDEVELVLVFLLGWCLRRERGEVHRRTAKATWTESTWRVHHSHSWRDLVLVDQHGQTIGLTPNYRDRLESMRTLLVVALEFESLFAMQMHMGAIMSQRDAAGFWLCYFMRRLLKSAYGEEPMEAGAREHYMALQRGIIFGITGLMSGVTPPLWLRWQEQYGSISEVILQPVGESERPAQPDDPPSDCGPIN